MWHRTSCRQDSATSLKWHWCMSNCLARYTVDVRVGQRQHVVALNSIRWRNTCGVAVEGVCTRKYEGSCSTHAQHAPQDRSTTQQSQDHRRQCWLGSRVPLVIMAKISIRTTASRGLAMMMWSWAQAAGALLVLQKVQLLTSPQVLASSSGSRQLHYLAARWGRFFLPFLPSIYSSYIL